MGWVVTTTAAVCSVPPEVQYVKPSSRQTLIQTVQSKLPIVGMLLGMVIVCGLSWVSYRKIGEFQSHVEWVDQTNQIRFELSQTVTALSDAQAAVRGFAVTGNPEFLTPLNKANTLLPVSLAKLNTLAQSNPAQIHSLQMLGQEVTRFMGLMQYTVTLQTDGGSAVKARDFIAAGTGNTALADIRSLVGQMLQREAQWLEQKRQNTAQSASDTRFLLVSGTLVSLLAFALAYSMLSRSIARRISAESDLLGANTQLVKNTERLETANTELESFSYSISHDLRIPLRAVAGYADMLSEDYASVLDDEGKRLLGVICENSERMGVLIDDLLTFSKLGRRSITATEIDMRALVDNVIAELRSLNPTAVAHITVEQLPPVSGDRALIRQVWTNLISNALKYSSKNAEAHISISGVVSTHECTYAIRDNGVGFDMQYYTKLFGVFQRLHSAEEFTGTGVGLAIVQRIVQRHGGRVWATGAVNQGATFNFALPATSTHD